MINDEMNKYYKDMINKELTSSRQVGWRDELAQARRFQQLYKLVENEDEIQIADLGCGLADFYNFLEKYKKNFIYVGYDLSEDMIKNAEKRIDKNKNNIELNHITKTEDMAEHDFTILSGIFNMKREVSNEEWLNYILNQLKIINSKSKKGFAFNLLTSYSDDEYKKDELFYAEPSFFFDFCKKNFSKNIALLHDYDEYDFTIIVRK